MDQINMSKLTKIIATIGPASDSEENLTAMIKAGMNVARFNTKHSEPAWHNERIQRVHQIAKKLGVAVAVLLDLQGPEIRGLTPNQQEFDLGIGETMIITDQTNAAGKVLIVPPEVVAGLTVGSEILLEDGACEFEIIDKEAHQAIAQAKFACVVKHRKTMNTPGLVLEMPSLTARDLEYLDGVDLKFVDYVGLSFVRNIHDLEILESELVKRQAFPKIISKIENQTALDNLDSIIQASDAVMVARGDLGVEVPYQQLIFWQKEIINRCRESARPVITATEMLKSMVSKPRPTRAEVSDVAHAIYDGTDAIMLSDETTIGQYPIKVVETQATIAASNEKYVSDFNFEWDINTPIEAICFSANELLASTSMIIDQVICVSPNGEAARILASFHVRQPVQVLTDSEATYRQTALMFGVTAHLCSNLSNASNEVLNQAKKLGVVHAGETILYLYSSEDDQHQKTTLSILTLS